MTMDELSKLMNKYFISIIDKMEEIKSHKFRFTDDST